MKKGLGNKRGFTVIEVMLVLAIAGLIFMMVFIALPQLQKTQRDADRKNDLLAVVTALQKYQSNHRGSLSSITIDDLKGYIDGNFLTGEKFLNPDGKEYEFQGPSVCVKKTDSDKTCKDTDITDLSKILVKTNATCNGQKMEYSNNPRNFAAMLKLEVGDYYCEHN